MTRSAQTSRTQDRRRGQYLLGLALAVFALPPTLSSAVEWEIQPNASTQVTVSDNIGLQPDGLQEAGAVYRASVGALIRGSGRRMRYTGDNTISLVKRTDRDSVQVDHRINSIGSFEFVENRLAVDGSLFSGRELVSDTAPVSGNPSNDLSSSTTVTSASISPYWQQRYGQWAQSLVRYRHTEVLSEGDGSANSRNDSLNLQLVAGERFQPWRPALTAEWVNNNEDANSAAIENDLTRYSVVFFNQFALSRRYSLTASVGYDRIDSASQTRDLSGLSWSIGAIGQPGPRSSFTIAVGQRFNDLAINGSAAYALTSHLTMQVSASHSLTSGLQQLVSDRNLVTVDPTTGELVTPQGLPVGFNSPQLDGGLSLRQDLQSTLVGNYGRNTIRLSGLVVRREFDVSDDLSAQARASVTRRLTPHLSAIASGSYQFASSALDVTTHTATGRFDLNYRLGPRTTLFGGYAYTNRRSSVATQDYAEHSATVGGRVTF